ncbi:MAG: YHYH protein [Ilumatobacter sp.]
MTNPHSRKRLGAAALVGAMTLAACGSDDAASTDTTPVDTTTDTASEAVAETSDESDADASATATSTLAGIDAAQWGDNVTIEVGDDTFNFQSNGLPSHEIPDQFLVPTTGSFTPPVTADEVAPVDSSIAVVETPVDLDLPLVPEYSDTTTDTNLGTIGIAISGAQLFNDYEDQDRSFVAVDDNFEIDGVAFVDSCNGHPLALQADGTGSGTYHYHGVPYCITDAVDADGEHSSILGFLLDGFPFYGPQDANGTAITSDELDECSGHVGPTPEFPEGIYHYHLTEDRSPYTVDCYHGVIESSGTGDAGGPADGGPPADGEAAGERAGGPPADDAAPADDTAAPAAVDVDELALRTAVLESAQWSDDVTITIDANTVTFQSDGLPSHEYLDTYLGDGRDGKFIAGGVEAYDATFSFPLVPTPGDSPTDTGNGAIGVAISGAVYFDPYEGDGSATVANDDNTTIDGIPFIDACGGHPLPNAVSYHYHGIPFCITDAVDTPGEHSVLIGYLFDGYPIYGPQDVDGEEPGDLDECMGHVGPTPEFGEDTYHYHVSAEANYISECLTGIS